MKIKRQSKLLELINKYDIDTQEMLVEKLNNEGFNITQATISRDIRELNISKISSENGKQKYAVASNETQSHNKKFIRVFNEGVVSIDYAQNLIVIKTLTGMAMAVAAAIDSMNDIGIIGTIAGDDTIFCATKSESSAIKIIERLKANITAD